MYSDYSYRRDVIPWTHSERRSRLLRSLWLLIWFYVTSCGVAYAAGLISWRYVVVAGGLMPSGECSGSSSPWAAVWSQGRLGLKFNPGMVLTVCQDQMNEIFFSARRLATLCDWTLLFFVVAILRRTLVVPVLAILFTNSFRPRLYCSNYGAEIVAI